MATTLYGPEWPIRRDDRTIGMIRESAGTYRAYSYRGMSAVYASLLDATAWVHTTWMRGSRARYCMSVAA